MVKCSEIKPGIYRHYKGKEYEVICVARHSETSEELVIYRTLYYSEKYGGNAVLARPKSMFTEKICIDGKKVPRFRAVKSC